MGVQLTQEALRDAVGTTVFETARKLFDTGAVGEIAQARGGACADVRDETDVWTTVWVGIVNGELTSACPCGHTEDLCPHAVALALAAVDASFVWHPGATDDEEELDRWIHKMTQAAEQIPHSALARVAVEFAAQDPRLETRLLVEAGQLGAMSQSEADLAKALLDDLAADAVCGHWDLHDLIVAGESIIETVETLAQRPASPQALHVVEHAARLWDGLAGHLFDDHAHFEGVPEEIGAQIRQVHLDLCEELPTQDLGDLRARIREITQEAEHISCLDSPTEYEAFLA